MEGRLSSVVMTKTSRADTDTDTDTDTDSPCVDTVCHSCPTRQVRSATAERSSRG